MGASQFPLAERLGAGQWLYLISSSLAYSCRDLTVEQGGVDSAVSGEPAGFSLRRTKRHQFLVDAATMEALLVEHGKAADFLLAAMLRKPRTQAASNDDL